MKRLAATLCLSALATAAFAQGTINVANSGTTAMRTNSIATGGARNNTAPGVGGFYYAILVAPSTVTTVDSSLQALLTPIWSDTGLTPQSTAFATGGRVSGGSGVAANNWPAGTAESFIMVGWSADQGTSWSAVSSKLLGAHFNSAGYWDQGPNLVNGGFLGATTIQAAASGGGSSGLPAFSVFGSGGSAQGTPITTPTDLYVINVPEPTSFALLGLGSAALLIFRRRK